MLQFDWDEDNAAHILLHQVSTHEAEEVLNGELLEIDSYDVNGEERVEEVGMTDLGRILHVISTIRGGRIRVVTAYDAVKSIKLAFPEYQRKYYE